MGYSRPFSWRDPRGNTRLLDVVECLNVTRTPQLRERVLAGTFHRVTDAHVPGGLRTIEKSFVYADFERNQFFLVKPRQERETWPEASADLARLLRAVDDELTGARGRHARVVFGLAELREKLVAADAALDDRVVEIAKVLLIHDHPFLLKRPRLRLLLETADATRLQFVACYDHAWQKFRLALERERYDAFSANPRELAAWVAKNHSDSLLADDAQPWINFWRWSPTLTALRALKDNAARVRAEQPVDPNAIAFHRMLRRLPRGSQLPSWAKRDLQTLFEWSKAIGDEALQAALFEIRFDNELEDDWHLNDDPEDVDTLWKLLRDLPDVDVDGRIAIEEIHLAEGQSGGWYEPSSHDIYIGSVELDDRARFADVLRHEVGHALHVRRKDEIDRWLAKRFGWRMFGAQDADVDAWVASMGGYGDVTAAEQKDIRRLLVAALGEGELWTPPPLPLAQPSHPWNHANFGPRLAIERTGAYWHERNEQWFRKDGKAYALNYWYRTFMVVDADTLELVNATLPDRYAAMSPMEFFAELYALHHDPTDPRAKKMPADVARWLARNVGKPAGAPRGASRAAPRKKPKPRRR